MAWEMDRSMDSYIEPSIALAASEESDPNLWLAGVAADIGYAEQNWTSELHDQMIGEYAAKSEGELIRMIAASARKESRALAGGSKFYVGFGSWEEIAYCNEDTMLAWHS